MKRRYDQWLINNSYLFIVERGNYVELVTYFRYSIPEESARSVKGLLNAIAPASAFNVKFMGIGKPLQNEHLERERSMLSLWILVNLYKMNTLTICFKH